MRHQTQGVIAGQMTVLIVVGLEVIDIQHQQRHGFIVEGAAGALALEHVLQPAPVETTGEGVDVGVLLAVENLPVALAHAVAEQFQQVLHHLRGLLKQRHQRLAMQAQDDGGAFGDHVGGGVFVVDEADFTGAVADFEGADGLVFQ
ncbi:hypothetical protein PSAL108031_11795 [Ectopseudomonas alcaliphila]